MKLLYEGSTHNTPSMGIVPNKGGPYKYLTEIRAKWKVFQLEEDGNDKNKGHEYRYEINLEHIWNLNYIAEILDINREKWSADRWIVTALPLTNSDVQLIHVLPFQEIIHGFRASGQVFGGSRGNVARWDVDYTQSQPTALCCHSAKTQLVFTSPDLVKLIQFEAKFRIVRSWFPSKTVETEAFYLDVGAACPH